MCQANIRQNTKFGLLMVNFKSEGNSKYIFYISVNSVALFNWVVYLFGDLSLLNRSIESNYFHFIFIYDHIIWERKIVPKLLMNSLYVWHFSSASRKFNKWNGNCVLCLRTAAQVSSPQNKAKQSDLWSTLSLIISQNLSDSGDLFEPTIANLWIPEILDSRPSFFTSIFHHENKSR